jgi:polyvinyl alcohol dehydrogenase (cytochrome)
VRTAVVLGRPSARAPLTAYFGDSRSNVYALNAATGVEIWSKQVETHASARVTGAPTLHQNRLYIPVSSGEEGQGGNAKYECCTFRGSVVALDATSGALAWKTYTIANEPKPIGKNRSGLTRWGPSGAGIWASPTVDVKRGLLYAATGNMYTEPQQTTSDAVIAFTLATGQIAWTAQVTPRDVFVVGCNQPNAPNCTDDTGPDFDFGNSPMLVRAANRDLIVIGQKSGVGWALDPDQRGAIVWQYRAGDGSALGGMEFGSSADSERAYFPVADGNGPHAGELHAVRLDTGERVWMTPAQTLKCGVRGRGCSPAILAAISVMPGAVLAGANDGGVRAYSTKDGAILWEFDTNREFVTVNGVAAKGASISGPGPAIGAGMVFVNSGYGSLGGRAGNVLLAFGTE